MNGWMGSTREIRHIPLAVDEMIVGVINGSSHLEMPER